jgi:2-desacetyl-2-hydroxyethyl bacteriochlorophyllide A dehydrogenase
MRAYVMTGASRGAVQHVPNPQLGEYDAAVEMLWCGVCSSTDHMLRSGTFRGGVTYPSVLGHESVGRVTVIGAGVRNLAVGDVVTRPAAYAVGRAPLAMHWGGLAEHGVVTDFRALSEDRPSVVVPATAPWVVLPADTDPESAALAISLSETYSVACRQDLLGSDVVVVGTGIAGLSLVRWAKLLGARRVIAVGRRQERLRLAELSGADEVRLSHDAVDNLHGVDVVFEASGQAEMVDCEFRWLRPGGSLVIYSAPTDTATLDLMAAPRNAHISVAATAEQAVLAQVLPLIVAGVVPRDEYVTHRYELSDIGRCFEDISDGSVVKALVRLS